VSSRLNLLSISNLRTRFSHSANIKPNLLFGLLKLVIRVFEDTSETTLGCLPSWRRDSGPVKTSWRWPPCRWSICLAAKQLAQARGAEVFATVGTADKARFLSKTTNIPASHIFGSREVSELSRAVAATGGRGLDVILRACKGDMLY
jgi:hypothetical protein